MRFIRRHEVGIPACVKSTPRENRQVDVRSVMNALLSIVHKLQIASAIQTREARSCMQRTALNTMARKRNTFIRCCTGACSLCIAWRRPACSGMRDCTFMCAPRHFTAINPAQRLPASSTVPPFCCLAILANGQNNGWPAAAQVWSTCCKVLSQVRHWSRLHAGTTSPSHLATTTVIGTFTMHACVRNCTATQNWQTH